MPTTLGTTHLKVPWACPLQAPRGRVSETSDDGRPAGDLGGGMVRAQGPKPPRADLSLALLWFSETQ